MVVAYVSVSNHPRVYALLLPDAGSDSTWAEVDVRRSPVSGSGVFPQITSDWDCLGRRCVA